MLRDHITQVDVALLYRRAVLFMFVYGVLACGGDEVETAPPPVQSLVAFLQLRKYAMVVATDVDAR